MHGNDLWLPCFHCHGVFHLQGLFKYFSTVKKVANIMGFRFITDDNTMNTVRGPEHEKSLPHKEVKLSASKRKLFNRRLMVGIDILPGMFLPPVSRWRNKWNERLRVTLYICMYKFFGLNTVGMERNLLVEGMRWILRDQWIMTSPDLFCHWSKSVHWKDKILWEVW